MTHQEIEEKGIIERYVLHQLSSDERLAFQEHYFGCDECFERAQTEARFIAGVRESSRSGVLAGSSKELAGGISFKRRLLGGWIVPALAASLLVALALTALWALSVRRENQRLAQQTSEERITAERLRQLEDQIRELESSGAALEEQKDLLANETKYLKEQLAAAEQQRERELAALSEPDINVPIRNIYPSGEAQRSGRAGEVNRVHMPRGTRTFLLILGDYKPGYSSYRVEILESGGREVAHREGLKPDQNGELSVLLSRTLLDQSKYRLKLYAGAQLIAEYVIRIE